MWSTREANAGARKAPIPIHDSLLVIARAFVFSIFFSVFNRARDGLVGWTELCGVRRPETDPKVERRSELLYMDKTRAGGACYREMGMDVSDGEDGERCTGCGVVVLLLLVLVLAFLSSGCCLRCARTFYK